MAPLFGYGSLILPTSLISRFENVSPHIDEVYKGDATEHVRADALAKWENRKDRIKYIPAKISGFRRYYSLKSKRGGTMLEAVRTGNKGDWINGVVVFGLTSTEEQQIAATEQAYEYEEAQNPELDFYIESDCLEEYDIEQIDSITLFASGEEPDVKSICESRNEIYHNRIITGIMMIGEMYGTEVATEFYSDFCRTTYEVAYDDENGDRFNTVKENNDIKGKLEWPSQP